VPVPLKPLPPRPARAVATKGSPLDRIRDLADRGLLGPAEAECKLALASGQASPALYLYQALIAAQGDRAEPAAEALGKALELDPGYVPALFYQGLFARDRNDRHVARTAFQGLRAHLARLAPTQRFPEMDGITVREVGELAAMHLRALE
jgi:hypothetical protein